MFIFYRGIAVFVRACVRVCKLGSLNGRVLQNSSLRWGFEFVGLSLSLLGYIYIYMHVV